jgi:hypothetical protein
MTDNELTNKWSLYSLLLKYYKAKQFYYETGDTSLTDNEYDALEGTIKAIHGLDTLDVYGCVGFDREKYQGVLRSYEMYNSMRNERHKEWNDNNDLGKCVV